MKFIVIGRTGTGKKSFLKSLTEHGINVCKFYTTNPDDAEIYDVITADDDRDFKGIILRREIDGFLYFTEQERFERCQVICTDIAGMKEICKANPDTAFRLINIQMADDARLLAYLKDVPLEQKITAEEDFIAACLAENEAHTEIEKFMSDGEIPYGIENITAMHAVINNGLDSEFDNPMLKFYGQIEFDTKVHGRMFNIVRDLCSNKMLEAETGENGDVSIKFPIEKDGKTTSNALSADLFTEFILRDAYTEAQQQNNSVLSFFTGWLSCDSSFVCN